MISFILLNYTLFWEINQSFGRLFCDCDCLEKINFIKCERNDIQNLYIINAVTHQIYFPRGVRLDDEYYFATTKINSVMDDIGKLYTFEKLAGGSEFNYVLLFIN